MPETSEVIDFLRTFFISMKNKGHSKEIQQMGIKQLSDMVLDEVYSK